MQGQASHKIRLAIFGVGMHFQETYSMAFKRKSIQSITEIAWVTDLASKQTLALQRCKDAQQNPLFVGVPKFSGQNLPEDIEKLLDKTLGANPVDAVIISTTPEQHHAYAQWAIKHAIPTLIDKPITTRAQAMWDANEAKGILDDWESLNTLATARNCPVIVNSHRRFHPAYTKVSQLLQEVAEQSGTGVTALSSFNSDGQWRLPQELFDIHYHGYENGNGVISHFGYHYLDLATLWYRNGTPSQRRANKMRVSSSFSSAQNYASQLSTKDANHALQQVGQPTAPGNDKQLQKKLSTYGEVDAFCDIEMVRDNTITAHMSIQLLHSGFSQRAWTKPATNLYKENGRVRWENHLIQQGPFQSIEVRSFQAVQPNWKHPDQGIPRWDLGGSDHLEINIYRNSILGKPVLETINCRELVQNIPENDVIHEDTKANVLELFVVYVAQETGITIPARPETKERLRTLAEGDLYDISHLSTHQATAALMSAFYESYASINDDDRKSIRVEKEIQW